MSHFQAIYGYPPSATEIIYSEVASVAAVEDMFKT
jgi:hypothetical protein